MNTKWFSGIGLAILLGTGAFIYTTKTQARPAAATAAKPDPILANLTTCATEKNPAYLESVLKGAMNAFDKDAKAALKAGKPAEFKKANKNLLKVIKFLFVQSKHFSPVYREAAHKSKFDKDIDKVIQTLLKAEYAVAKSQSAQKEVIKDYTAVVAELTKDGVEGLTPIAVPVKTKSALEKIKGGLSKAAKSTKKLAKKGMAKIKGSDSLKKGLAGAGAAAISGGGAAAIAKAAIQPEDDAAPTDDASDSDASAGDSGDDDAAPSDEGASDDSGADLQKEDAGTFEPEEDAPSDEGASDDGDADLQKEDAGTFEPEEDAQADEEAPADDSSDVDPDAQADDEATDEEAPADDSGDDADNEAATDDSGDDDQ